MRILSSAEKCRRMSLTTAAAGTLAGDILGEGWGFIFVPLSL
jgi:hypothetical protein